VILEKNVFPNFSLCNPSPLAGKCKQFAIFVPAYLWEQTSSPFDSYDSVTLMFSGIVGFGQYCAANTDPDGAMKIVKMLNELYTVFDALTDSKRNLNVYKVGQSANAGAGHHQTRQPAMAT